MSQNPISMTVFLVYIAILYSTAFRCVNSIEVTVNTCTCTKVFYSSNNKGPIRWDI